MLSLNRDYFGKLLDILKYKQRKGIYTLKDNICDTYIKKGKLSIATEKCNIYKHSSESVVVVFVHFSHAHLASSLILSARIFFIFILRSGSSYFRLINSAFTSSIVGRGLSSV